MTDQPSAYSPLSAEQLSALTETQKAVFLQLDGADRQFFAGNFSPASLGKALDRKAEAMQSRQRVTAHDQKIKENLLAGASAPVAKPSLSAGEIAAGAAGVAGLVGVGVLARQIAPDGQADWRGVTPRDLVDPLVKAFARQEQTDIRFDPPNAEGVLHATVLLRSKKDLTPALDISLTPLQNAVRVQIGKLTSESVIQTVKEGSEKLLDLVKDGLKATRKGDMEDLLDVAGKVIDRGADLTQSAKDLDLEDRAWEVIKAAADPLQTIYDEKMAAENALRLKLETSWDDYYACPRCRVEFGAQDQECRVCGATRPPMPEQADPRKM